MNLEEKAARLAPFVLSILRIVAALLFIEHGTSRLLGWPSTAFPISSPMYGAAGAIELVGGLFVLLGLWTRPVAFVLSGEMAFAYFLSHFPRNNIFPILNGGDGAVLYCFIFLYLAFAGAGPWSLDAMMRRAK